MSDARCRICRKPAGGTHASDCVWEDLVVPSECEGVIEAAVAVVTNRDYARGVAAERARVVASIRAWLRGDGGFVQLSQMLDAIERGEGA